MSAANDREQKETKPRRARTRTNDLSVRPSLDNLPRRAKEGWPFRYYEEKGRMYRNVRTRVKPTPEPVIEEAPW